MLKIYYTSKKGEDEVQTRADLSLGGYRSSTVIPNNSFNNLFSDLSYYSIQRNQDEFIGVIVKNESEIELTGVGLWFEFPELSQRKVYVSAVDLTVDGRMEDIQNSYQQPYYAEFHEADGELNKVDLGNFAPGEQIGIWFKSSINKEVITQQYSDEYLEANGSPKESPEEIKIIFEWS